MQLSTQHKLQLLLDILEDHQSDCTGSANECAQIKRLADSILFNNELVNKDLEKALSSISTYGQTGANLDNLSEHVDAHRNEFSGWLQTVTNHLSSE